MRTSLVLADVLARTSTPGIWRSELVVGVDGAGGPSILRQCIQMRVQSVSIVHCGYVNEWGEIDGMRER
jgi:hypothetical protein